MSDSSSPRTHTAPGAPGYRVHLLCEPVAVEGGVLHRVGASTYILEWDRVQCALAADVGEPEGVCTIVFDLVTNLGAEGCVACRMSAEPGDEAMEVARAVERGLADARCFPSVQSVATDGKPARWYPDLISLDEANLEAVRGK